MSYLVLARKYRPKTFEQLVGQSHVVQALTNALRSQRLHHAYLFTGTRGVGKTTVSRILAKSLNCETGITAEPCGVCSACTEIDAGRFVDYTELDAASNRGVDEVQQLLEQAVYKPVQGRFKVFMIDEVHMLSNTAFNAMLKTLEEPPEYLKFVLATTDPHKVPVTVLSRCLQFNLRPMPPETIVEHLGQVLGDEHISADVQALRLIARAARGSMRDALSLTDQAIAFGNGELQEPTVRDMLGSVDRSHVFTFIEALAHGDGLTIVNTCEALRQLGLSASSLLEDMSMVLQRMAVYQSVTNAAEAATDPDPDAQRILALAELMPADETQLLYSICLHGRTELGLAPDEYAALCMVLLRLLAFKPEGAAEKKTLKTAEAQSFAAPAAKAASAVSKPAAPPAREVEPASAKEPISISAAPQGRKVDVVSPVQRDTLPVSSAPAQVGAPMVTSTLQFTPLGNDWFEVVQQLVKAQLIQAMTRELAMQSQLVQQDATAWVLQVERESLNSPSNRERLQLALQALGHAVSISVQLGPVQDTPAKRITTQQNERQQAAEDEIMNDPLVQQLIRDFDATIVPGSIKPLAH
jgi:DNA polymerase III subunit gamma/tau